LIHDFVASELTDAANDMNISYVVFLALEIILCFITAFSKIDLNENPATFCRFSFSIFEMRCANKRGIMDVTLNRGEFYESLQNPQNTSFV
jgi:hypothetical protein